MKIIKIAMNYGYGCWLSPDGKEIDVPPYNHDTKALEICKNLYAKEIFDKSGRYIGDNYDSFGFAIGELLDRGWVKVRYIPLTISYRGKLPQNIKIILFNYINQDEDDLIYVTNGINSTEKKVNKIDARNFIRNNS